KFDPGTAADEAAGLEMIGGGDAVMAQEPAQAGEQLADSAIVTVDGHGLPAAVLDHDIRVVVQIGAHRGQVAVYLNAERAQIVGPAKPRTLQELWRVDRTASDNHLAVRVCGRACSTDRVLDTDGATLVEYDAMDERLGPQHQAWVVEFGIEIGAGRA